MSSATMYPSYKLSVTDPGEIIARLRSDVYLKPMIVNEGAPKKNVSMLYVNSRMVYRGNITCTLGKPGATLEESELITQKFDTTLENEAKQKMTLVFKFPPTSLIEKNVEGLETVIAERFTEQIWNGVQSGEPMFACMKSWVMGLNEGKRPYAVGSAVDGAGKNTTRFSGPLYEWVLDCMKSRIMKHELYGSGLKVRAWGDSENLTVYRIEFKEGKLVACDEDDEPCSIENLGKGVVGMSVFEVGKVWFKTKDGRKNFKGTKVLDEWGSTFTLKTFGLLKQENKDSLKLEASAKGLIDGMPPPPTSTFKRSALGEPPAKKRASIPDSVRVVTFADDIGPGHTFDANSLLKE